MEKNVKRDGNKQNDNNLFLGPTRKYRMRCSEVDDTKTNFGT